MTATTRFRLTAGPRCGLGLFICFAAATAGGCAKVSMTTPPGGSGGSTVSVVTIPGLVSLAVSPPSATIGLTLNNGQIVPGMSRFTVQATLNDGSSVDATDRVTWSLIPALGMAQGGNVTVTAPGIFSVTASNGPISGTAHLTATFSGKFNEPAFDIANASKLDGAATANAVNIAYPLEGAVFPSNLGEITVHVSKSGAQDIARLTFTGEGLLDPGIQFYAGCDPVPPGAGCYVNVPPAITKLLLAPSTNANVKLTARLASSTGGGTVESNTIGVAWADVALSGGLYYWSTIQPGVVPNYVMPGGAMVGTGILRYNLDQNGAEPEKDPVYTDQGTPPNFYGSPPSPMDGAQCVGCHAITSDGKTMALSVGGAQDSDLILLDIATKTLTAFNPALSVGIAPPPPRNIGYFKQFSRASIATETVFGPKGDVMVNMYRSQFTLRTANVSLATQGVMLPYPGAVVPSWTELKTDPFWSYTGKYFVFASYPAPLKGMYNPDGTNGDIKTGSQIVIADANDTGVMDNARALVARKGGVTSFYPVVSTDDALVAYDQSTCGNGGVDVNKMGTDYGSGTCDGYDDSSAVLWLTSPSGRTPVRLDHANGGAGNDNSWPRFSPNIGSFRGQQLYWLAFSSRRAYGLQVNAGVQPIATKPQLWFAAVVTGAEFSGDPSFAPVWLPKQNPSQALPSGNHVPQWVKVAVPIQ